MKILTVTREWSNDRRYGLGKSLAPLIQYFENNGIYHYYLCQEDLGEKAASAPQHVVNLTKKIQRIIRCKSDLSILMGIIIERLNMGRLAVKVAARDQYTHVNLHDPIIAAGYRFFSVFTPRCKAKWGITQHGFGCYTQAIIDENIYLSPLITHWMKRWELRTVSASDWLISPTLSSLKQTARDLGTSGIPAHWHSIPHPKPNIFIFPQKEARETLKWQANEQVVLAIGRLIPLKRFDLIIQAISKIDHVRLVILGEGNQAPLLSLAHELGCHERLSFEVTDNIGLYLSACDIYVSTSQTESFGMANFEAMIAAKPCIFTAAGGVPEVASSGAQLIPVDDLNALNYALNVLLHQPSQRVLWSAQSLKRANEWPNVQLLAKQHIQLYQTGEISPLPSSNTKKQMLLSSISPAHSWGKSLNLCPLPQVQTINNQHNNLKVLVFSPHPDDETLGCGGTLAKLVQAGAQVRVILMSLGEKGFPEGFDPSKAGESRKTEFITAMGVLGITDIDFYNLPDSEIHHSKDLVESITEEFYSYSPQWLYIPSPLDSHRDHVTVSLSVLSTWESLGYKQRIWLYEIWSPLPASHVVDITQIYSLKEEALLHYEIPLQCQNYLHHITGLNSYRGLSIHSENAMAEGFTEITPLNLHWLIPMLLDLRTIQEP
jgi:LmbE family N-acetylglucosaminyl deacetylase/glycosyltransferase involved in cell wall biosynthesis